MALDSDLTTAQTVADELGVGVGELRLPRLISAASEAIRRYLNRPRVHYSAAFVEVVTPHLATPRLVLGLCPVGAIASVVLADGTVVTASDYSVEDSDAGFLYRSTGWTWSGLLRAGLLYADPAVGTEKPAITVTYAGGWVTPVQAVSAGWVGPARSLPYDLEEACVQTVVSLYRKGGADQTIASEALGDYSVSYRTPNIGVGAGGIMPDSVLAILDSYRRPLG